MAAPSGASCRKDADCPGDQICESGMCADASDAPTDATDGLAPSSTPASRSESTVESGVGTPPVTAPAVVGGSILVQSTERASVLMDRGKAGEVAPGRPLRLTGIAEGRHKIIVMSTLGGSTTESVTVVPGQEVAVRFEPSEFRSLARFREGPRFGLGLTGIHHYVGGADLHGGGGALEALLNVGAAPAVDFRVAVDLGLESIDGAWEPGAVRTASGCTACERNENKRVEYWNTPAVVPSAAVALHLNLGSIYGMSFGFRGGFAALLDTADYKSTIRCLCYGGCSFLNECKTTMESRAGVLAQIGPEWSVLAFRMGERREVELEFWQGLVLPMGRETAYNQGISFRYLFLGDPEGDGGP